MTVSIQSGSILPLNMQEESTAAVEPKLPAKTGTEIAPNGTMIQNSIDKNIQKETQYSVNNGIFNNNQRKDIIALASQLPPEDKVIGDAVKKLVNVKNSNDMLSVINELILVLRRAQNEQRINNSQLQMMFIQLEGDVAKLQSDSKKEEAAKGFKAAAASGATGMILTTGALGAQLKFQTPGSETLNLKTTMAKAVEHSSQHFSAITQSAVSKEQANEQAAGIMFDQQRQSAGRADNASTENKKGEESYIDNLIHTLEDAKKHLAELMANFASNTRM